MAKTTDFFYAQIQIFYLKSRIHLLIFLLKNGIIGLTIIPRGIFMAAIYNKLWKLLIDKGMTKTDLRLKTGMSTSTLAKMSKNENVSLDVILSICKVLECNIGDVVDATDIED